MTDWTTIASLATAGGTLVLAVATFASVRSANRSARSADRAARIAERSLLAGQRPLLVTSRLEDPEQKVEFTEGNRVAVQGGRATLEVTAEAVYAALLVRNAGPGLAVLLGWQLVAGLPRERVHPPLEEFTSQIRDIYVAPGENAAWQGALRDPAETRFKAVTAAHDAGDPLMLSLLYGDREGGQQVISQFAFRRGDGDTWLALVARHFNVDRPDPR